MHIYGGNEAMKVYWGIKIDSKRNDGMYVERVVYRRHGDHENGQRDYCRLSSSP